jgi:hypothetical protein
MSEIRDRLAENHGEDLLFLDPDWQFDPAIVGVADRCGMEAVVVYDRQEVIEALIRDGLNEEEAMEFADFNVFGAYVGSRTPIYIDFLPKDANDAR